MLARHVWRDLVRNPRRSLATLVGVTFGVGLFCAVLFFIDGSSASMTQRALAPLPIDMQRVLTTPLSKGLRLTETRQATGPLAKGERVEIRLVLTNGAAVPANEVVLRSEPSASLLFVPGSATVDGAAVRSRGADNPFAHGQAKAGLNVGTVAAGATIVATYQVEATSTRHAIETADVHSSYSTREVVIPVRANAPGAVSLHDLAQRVGALDGVAYAEELSFVDVPPRSLSSRAKTADAPARVFGFDASYAKRDPAIRVVDGSLKKGEALLSAEAAASLGVGVGGTVSVQLPGSAPAIDLRISGIADLSRARTLFFSRQGTNLEEFIYVRNSVVVDSRTFADLVLKSFKSATSARGDQLKSLPILEVDIGVERGRLDADPGAALGQTAAIARAVTKIAPGQDYLIDNVSNTLQVAKGDAGVAKGMFIFLGVPGAMLAAILAAYAGSVLAGAQRREQATLRIRGANRRHLLRMLGLRTLLLTAAGSLLGVGLGFLSTVWVLGSHALARASTLSLVVSGFVGAASGFLATGTALYVAGRRSISRDINEDRARIDARPPLWRRARLDLAGVPALAIGTVLAVRANAFVGTAGSVYEGRAVDLKLALLVLPLAVWLTGTLVAARAFAALARNFPDRTRQPFSHPVRGLLSRSVRRRSWSAAGGMIVVTLIVALGASVASFTASYDSAKSTDARFNVGSDLRITPSAAIARRLDARYATQLQVDGVTAATPVVFSTQNSVLRSDRNSDVANVAAVDPRGFLAVAALDDANFVGMTARHALGALAADPSGVLLSTDMADFLSTDTGGSIHVLFGKGTKQRTVADMHVIGLFERLPGFPEGAQAMVNLSEQERLVPTRPDFFLARTADRSHATLVRAAQHLRAGPGTSDPIVIETREQALEKDKSSLAALNIHGLLTLDSSFALAMGTIAIAIFVFGLLLQRRREYVTLRAQGLHSREIRALIVAEAGGVAVAGCLAGIAVGVGMAYYFVKVLRPLFTLAPPFVVPPAEIAQLVVLVMVSAIVTSVAATSLVNRLEPTELLRDE